MTAKKVPTAKKASRPGHTGLTKEQRQKIEGMGRSALKGVVSQGRSALRGVKSLASSTAGLYPGAGPARTKLTKEEQQKRQKKIDAAISVLATLIPGVAVTLTTQKGVKALAKKEAKENGARRRPGSVKKRAKGGGVRKAR
jgi:hypothetical protein